MTKPQIPEESRWRGGRGPIRWSYTYKDLARLYGVTVQTIRKWVSAGKVKPGDLRSVMALLRERQS